MPSDYELFMEMFHFKIITWFSVSPVSGVLLLKKKKAAQKGCFQPIVWVVPRPRIPVANEGLGWDPRS